MRALERAVLGVRMPRKTEDTIERRPSRSERRGGLCDTRKERTEPRAVEVTDGEGGTESELAKGAWGGVREEGGRAREDTGRAIEEAGRLAESGPADKGPEERGRAEAGADSVASEIV
jgi:hypothetical protein